MTVLARQYRSQPPLKLSIQYFQSKILSSVY